MQGTAVFKEPAPVRTSARRLGMTRARKMKESAEEDKNMRSKQSKDKKSKPKRSKK